MSSVRLGLRRRRVRRAARRDEVSAPPHGRCCSGGERHLRWGWRLTLVLRGCLSTGLRGGVGGLGELHELAALLWRHRGEAVLVAQPLDLGLTLVAAQARGLLDELRDNSVALTLATLLFGAVGFAAFFCLADRVGYFGGQLLDQDLVEQILGFSLPRHSTFGEAGEAQRVVAGVRVGNRVLLFDPPGRGEQRERAAGDLGGRICACQELLGRRFTRKIVEVFGLGRSVLASLELCPTGEGETRPACGNPGEVACERRRSQDLQGALIDLGLAEVLDERRTEPLVGGDRLIA